MEPVDVVYRAFRILDCFIGSNAEMSLPDLTKRLEMPKTTVWRLIKTLESCGYLEEKGKGRYKLGRKALLLAAAYLNHIDVRRIALPVMNRIRDLTGETVYLNLLEGRQRIVLDHVVGTYEIVYVPSIGRITPLYAGASSKVMLAFLDEEEIDRILLKEDLKPLASRTINNISALKRELAKIRKDGYASSISELEEGLIAVSGPIRAPLGIVGSLTIGFPQIRYANKDMNLLIKLIKEGAIEISTHLGVVC
jgi:IclR family KDG regulon transcriptional repressor